MTTVAPTHAHMRQEGRTVTITVGDGTQRNALDRSQWQALRADADGVAERSDVSVVLLRGAAGTFCAGFRIHGWVDASADDIDEDFAAMEAALQAIEAIPVPTVAVVDGVAAGAGCQLALACDLRVVAASARLGMPILRLGILCSPEFALRLSSIAGPARARELLFTGRLLTAGDAESAGLVSEVVEDDALDATVAELVAKLLALPTPALTAAKRAVGVGLDARRREASAPGWRFSGADMAQRVRAFVAGAR